MTRPQTRDGHVPASGWRLRTPASGLPRLPLTNSAAGRATPGGTVSYQPPPDYDAGTAVRNPPGWYLDPIGLRSLRWWDGAAVGPEYATPARISVGASVSRSGRSCARLGDRRGPPAGRRRHRQQGGPHVARDMRRALGREPSSPVRTQAQPDPGRASRPPDRRTSSPACRDRRLQRATHHGSARNRKARGALTSLGALLDHHRHQRGEPAPLATGRKRLRCRVHDSCCG